MRIEKLSDILQRLDEKAVQPSEVAQVHSIGLARTERQLNGIRRVAVALYDFDSTLVLGYFNGYKHSSDGQWHQDMVYAVPGYGPMIHEMFMCAIAPGFVIPSRVIRPKAIRVWGLFQTLRTDVETVPLPAGHEYITDRIEYEETHYSSEPYALKAVNAMYRISPRSPVVGIYKELLGRGEQLIKSRGFSAGKIIRDAVMQFSRVYKADTIIESNKLPLGWTLPGIDRETASHILEMRDTKITDTDD